MNQYTNNLLIVICIILLSDYAMTHGIDLPFKVITVLVISNAIGNIIDKTSRK
jgi:lipoprotein signal peptidase